MEKIDSTVISTADINRSIARAHELRSEALYTGARAIGAFFKAQLRKGSFYLSRREHA